MALTFACPNGHTLTADESVAGRTMQCPTCGAQFVVNLPSSAPDAGGEASEPAPPDAAPQPQLTLPDKYMKSAPVQEQQEGPALTLPSKYLRTAAQEDSSSAKAPTKEPQEKQSTESAKPQEKRASSPTSKSSKRNEKPGKQPAASKKKQSPAANSAKAPAAGTQPAEKTAATPQQPAAPEQPATAPSPAASARAPATFTSAQPAASASRGASATEAPATSTDNSKRDLKLPIICFAGGSIGGGSLAAAMLLLFALLSDSGGGANAVAASNPSNPSASSPSPSSPSANSPSASSPSASSPSASSPSSNESSQPVESSEPQVELVDEGKLGRAELKEVTDQRRKNLEAVAASYKRFLDSIPTGFQKEHLDENGKPKVSWRVHLLSYLPDYQELGAQFKLDESWDSPHNSQLAGQMPKIYRDPLSSPNDVTTRVVSIMGDFTPFPKGWTECPEGRGFSPYVVYVGIDKKIHWMSPDDNLYNLEAPKACLGILHDGIHMIDPECRVVSYVPDLPTKTFRMMINPNRKHDSRFQYILKGYELPR